MAKCPSDGSHFSRDLDSIRRSCGNRKRLSVIESQSQAADMGRIIGPSRAVILLFFLFVFIVNSSNYPKAKGQSSYNLSITAQTSSTEMGSAVDLNGQLTPLPPVPTNVCVPACVRLQLQEMNLDSQIWNDLEQYTEICGPGVTGTGCQDFHSDGSFRIVWTPDMAGKFMVRTKLVSWTLVCNGGQICTSQRNVLATSNDLGWFEVQPRSFVGIPIYSNSEWNMAVGFGWVGLFFGSIGVLLWAVSRRQNPFRKETGPSMRVTAKLKSTDDSPDDLVGGLTEVKKALAEAIELPLMRPDLFERYRVVPPTKGLLLYGPPGCGKTLLAKSIAAKGKIAFVYCRSTDIFTKYYSESATRVRELFENARKKAPCVLFFDEIDALVPTRGYSDDATAREDVRVTSEFLAQMDGLTPLERVIVIAATNRPDAIDPALMRPGRFDRILYVPPPDLEARTAILRNSMHGVPKNDDVNLNEIARSTDGYSGADLVALCREAKMRAMKAEVEGSPRPVMPRDFADALTVVKPSISQAMLEKFEAFVNSFRRYRES